MIELSKRLRLNNIGCACYRKAEMTRRSMPDRCQRSIGHRSSTDGVRTGTDGNIALRGIK